MGELFSPLSFQNQTAKMDFDMEERNFYEEEKEK